MNTTPSESDAELPRAVAGRSRHRADLLANGAPIVILACAAALFCLASITASEMLSVYLHGGAAAALACGIGLYIANRLKRTGLLRCSAFG